MEDSSNSIRENISHLTWTGYSGHLGGDVYMQLVYKSGVGMRVCTEDTHERVITLELTMSHETA